MSLNEKIIVNEKGTFLQVKVIANASKNEFEEADEFFKLRIKAPACDNKANQEIIKYLSNLFGINKSSVEIIHGMKSSKKVILIKNYDYFKQQSN